MQTETVGLLIGFVLVLGVFSLKVAVGEYYLFSLPGSRTRKVFSVTALCALYGALFFAAFAVLERCDVLRFAGEHADFLRFGVPLHLILCAGLFLWGVRLLILREGETPGSLEKKGFLLLIVPCPVCGSAIFLACAFAAVVFPEYSDPMKWLAPGIFFLLNAVFLLLMRLTSEGLRVRPLTLTGNMMIFVALYFVLVLLAAPQLQDAGKLYSMMRSHADAFRFGVRETLSAAALAVFAACGFFRNISLWKER